MKKIRIIMVLLFAAVGLCFSSCSGDIFINEDNIDDFVSIKNYETLSTPSLLYDDEWGILSWTGDYSSTRYYIYRGSSYKEVISKSYNDYFSTTYGNNMRVEKDSDYYYAVRAFGTTSSYFKRYYSPLSNIINSKQEKFVLNASEITTEELEKAITPIRYGINAIDNEGTYELWGGKGSVTTLAGKMAFYIDGGSCEAIVSPTNMTGATAIAVPVVGENISSIGGSLKNYLAVDTIASKVTVKIKYSTKESLKEVEEGLSHWILITDMDGKILAVKDVGDLHSYTAPNQDFIIPDLTVGSRICIGFARGSASGGLYIHSVTQTKVEEE